MNIVQEEDRVSGRMVTLVMAVTIAIFAAAIAVAWWILVVTAGPGQPALPGAHQPIVKEMNAMDRWLFGEPHGMAGQRAELQRLDGYGWVDRKQGIIHVPIRRAMELYLNQHLNQQGGATPSVQPEPARPLPSEGTP